MGEAREVMDRMTAAMTSNDTAALAACYAEDAVASAPDQSEIKGREAISSYLSQMGQAFPDAAYEPMDMHEAGNVAIDEGYFTGTNTGELQLPTGEIVPPTGRQIRLRTCDVARVEGGVITSHHFYWDQMEFLEQLGLFPEPDPKTI
ncbi:ester cyclase [Arthrobacter mobilis]|uniref:Nuclear transport factor 2 family protein n=1 Tax=Arthrobacter mobilis TaxID=2724944 RepID=A0A7X6K729_9MICC|nr:nuclear transport factor 2 family protein [Arthrobacter mobilis]NKX56353.1 nuclear transport factor 2 family protein [Arthrobacter mobilis]